MLINTGRVLRVIAEMPGGQQASARLFASAYEMDESAVAAAVTDLAAHGYVNLRDGDVEGGPIILGVTPRGRAWVHTHRR